MEINKGFSGTFTALVGLNLVLAVITMGLFLRIGPSLDKQFEISQKSLELSGRMLSHLVAMRNESSPPMEEVFRNTLGETKKAETSEAALAYVADIENTFKSELTTTATEAKSTTRNFSNTAQAIQKLIKFHFIAMQKAKSNVEFLSHSGAWIAAFVAWLAFTTALFIYRHTQRSFMKPLEEIHSVLQAAREGDVHRRCTISNQAAMQLKAIESGLNDILDDKLMLERKIMNSFLAQKTNKLD